MGDVLPGEPEERDEGRTQSAAEPRALDEEVTMEVEVAPGRVIAVLEGDITRVASDVIVNAANEPLVPGGGVDDAIHFAGGPAILADLVRRYGEDRRCPPGSAVVSGAGDLPARWVVHAVGPVWAGGGRGEADVLASAYRASVALADGLGAESVAFPAISTGVFRYPPGAAAQVAVSACSAALVAADSVRRITLVAFRRDSLVALERALVAALR